MVGDIENQSSGIGNSGSRFTTVYRQMASRTVGSKSCSSRTDLEFRSKNLFSRGLSFSRSFSKKCGLLGLQSWAASPSSWGLRSPPPNISSPCVQVNSYSNSPTVSQMWYDLSVSSSQSACCSPKMTTSLKPPPSPSTPSRRFMFKRCGTANTVSNDDENPTLLEKMPSSVSSLSDTDQSDQESKESDYLTVYVGERSCKRVKYVISKHFLQHHLFQVLLKCSEDEVGAEHEFREGVPIVCDPALFVQLVTVVGATLFAEIPDSKCCP